MDTVVYALLNKKIRGLVSGVQSASVSGTTITFTMNDGSKQSITFPVPKDGLSITDVDVNADNTLTCTLSDGSTVTTTNKINVKDGFSPTAKVEKVDNKTTITIKDVNGTTTADVLDGVAFTYSDSRPTTVGNIGDIIFNSLPEPNGYVGWIYTALGWLGFGKIESTSTDIPGDAFLLSDGEGFMLADGTYFLCA